MSGIDTPGFKLLLSSLGGNSTRPSVLFFLLKYARIARIAITTIAIIPTTAIGTAVAVTDLAVLLLAGPLVGLTTAVVLTGVGGPSLEVGLIAALVLVVGGVGGRLLEVELIAALVLSVAGGRLFRSALVGARSALV